MRAWLRYLLSSSKHADRPHLFGDEERDALKQLVAVQRRDGEVEEESVQNWSWNEFQLLDEQNGQANQHVGQNASQAGLPYAHDPDTRIHTYISC